MTDNQYTEIIQRLIKIEQQADQARVAHNLKSTVFMVLVLMIVLARSCNQ